jgi:hypothetical protein
MEHEKIAKQMLDFQKSTFDNTFSAMLLVQEQGERMLGIALEQSPWVPQEGKKVINEWINACKKGQEDFRKTMDESFKKVEAFFIQSPKE